MRPEDFNVPADLRLGTPARGQLAVGVYHCGKCRLALGVRWVCYSSAASGEPVSLLQVEPGIALDDGQDVTHGVFRLTPHSKVRWNRANRAATRAAGRLSPEEAKKQGAPRWNRHPIFQFPPGGEPSYTSLSREQRQQWEANQRMAAVEDWMKDRPDILTMEEAEAQMLAFGLGGSGYDPSNRPVRDRWTPVLQDCRVECRRCSSINMCPLPAPPTG